MNKFKSRIHFFKKIPSSAQEDDKLGEIRPPDRSISRRSFISKGLILGVVTLFVAMFILVPGVFAQTTSYTVKSTDTLGTIALAHRVTVQSLMDANPAIKNPNVIFSGEKLTIPAPNLAPGESIWRGFRSTAPGATPVPVTGGAGTYVVKPHDTLGSIAFAHRVTVASLLAANPSIKNPRIIIAGERLSIPAANLAPGESIWHVSTTPATSVPVTGATATTTPMTTAQPTPTGIQPTQQPSQQPTAMATGAPSSQTVSVGETEFKLNMPTSVSAGMVTFNVTNNGTVPHSLEIEGQGIDQKLPSILQPGQTGTLQVNLQPGSYTVYCPVDAHRDQGMVVTLTVQ